MSDPSRLAERIMAHPPLAAVINERQALRLAEHVLGVALAGGFAIEWMEAAIDDVAGEVLAHQLGGEALSKAAVMQKVIRYARRPRRPRTPRDYDGEVSLDEHLARKSKRVPLTLAEARERWGQDVDDVG